jgi:TPR repeat protein
MKKIILFLCMAQLAVLSTNLAFGQSVTGYKNIIQVTFGKVRFELYCKIGSWGLGQQFYSANFYNQTFYKVHVKGEYVATLLCGNESVSKLDFTCDKYASIITVAESDKNFPYSYPHRYGTDFSGLVATADEQQCLGNSITAKISSDGKTMKTKDRITALQIRNLKLFSIQSDGSEMPITTDGIMMSEPVKGTSANVPKSQTVVVNNSQSTAAPKNVVGSSKPELQTNPGNTTPATTQQQVYQQQANNSLNAAGHSSDAIQQSLNMNNARLYAGAAGNSVQAQQVQQMQQQQQQANTEALATETGNAVVTIAGLFGKKSNSSYVEDRLTTLSNSSNPDDLVMAGIEYSLKNRYKKANEFFERAANMGSVEGMCKMAQAYLFGDGVAKNDSISNKWLLKAFETEYKRGMKDKIATINNLGRDLAHYSTLITTKQHKKPDDPFTDQDLKFALMSITCSDALDKTYSANYLNLTSTEIENLNFSRLNAAELLTSFSEKKITEFFKVKVSSGVTQVEFLKQALKWYNKIKESADGYLATGKEKDDYNKYFYKLNIDFSKKGIETVTQKLKDLGVTEVG